ncbi:MAG: hypothetical protein ACI849_000840 [Patiriisocius sp.]|jgi:hypothetical protein
MKTVYVLLLSFLFVSCGATVFVDYDPETNFTEYKTFQFTNHIESNVSSLDENRIIKAIDSVLVTKTWQRTDYCQFYIDFFVASVYEDPRSSVRVGAGTGGGGFGVGGSVGIPLGSSKIQENVTIEIYEAYNNGAMVWKGSLLAARKEKATPVQKELHYQKVIATILEKFPPQK